MKRNSRELPRKLGEVQRPALFLTESEAFMAKKSRKIEEDLAGAIGKIGDPELLPDDDTPEESSDSPGAAFLLTGKASVTINGKMIVRGDAITAAEYDVLLESIKPYFEESN